MAYWILKVVLSPVFFLLWRVKVEGREHVPTHGPAVLAANHQSFCDSFFLPLVLRRRVTYVAKAEYFDNWKTAWFFRAAGQIPMQRGGGDASQRALDTATEVLDGPEACSASIRRGPGRRTSVSTGATPEWPGWRWAAMCPSSRWVIVGTRAVQPPGQHGHAALPLGDHSIRPSHGSPCPGETMAVGPSGSTPRRLGRRSTNGSRTTRPAARRVARPTARRTTRPTARQRPRPRRRA